LFIINEQATLLYMSSTGHAARLRAYEDHFNRWVPGAELVTEPQPTPFDAQLIARVGGRKLRYLLVEKRHFRHQDAAVIADQLSRRRAALDRRNARDPILLLAPHVRAQQAAVLESAGIDYLDLAGNVHLSAPGLFVHVEGRRSPKAQVSTPGRPQKGWVKTVLALLVRPELVSQAYRAVAEQAGVSLGTVAACIRDLAMRGILLEDAEGRRMPDRAALVALWVPAYGEVLRPKLAERRLQVRVTDKAELWARLEHVLRERGLPWALTGADAASQRQTFFRAEDTEIYAPVLAFDDRDMQKAIVAQPSASGGNLLVIEPPGPLAIPETDAAALPVAPDLLAYAELRYRGTGQALEAAELLLPSVMGNGAA
jgi:hypothetical protein